MGLFDESDSDEDDKRPPSYTNINGGIEGSSGGIEGKEEEEEEDALDAYMKSISNAPTEKNNNASGGGGGRLDVEAEDEATSHWEIATKASSKVNATLLPKHEHDVSLQAQDNGKGFTKSVNLHGFVRAGTIKAQSSASQTINIHNGINNNKDDDNDDDDEFTNLNKVREHQVQLLHTEIDPLDKINHDTIQYNTFNRIFYKPSDTNHGHAWRKEHDVVCTPSYFDPILGFGELSSTTTNNNGSGVFPEELIRTIAQQGYDAPTLVQSQTLSVALSGNDALITVSFVTYVIYECLLHFSLCVAFSYHSVSIISF